jgi:EAL and modified HD-GYP domain-containing signal transduction protein
MEWVEEAVSDDTAVMEAEPVGDDVVLLARQPILDTKGTVHGHELLFRRSDGTGWPIDDESRATAQVLVSAFVDMSLGALTSGTRAWVNTPAAFLIETDLSVLPVDRVVLELLERDDVDPAFYARAVELARAGYQLALDDFTWTEDTARLLEVATYVKLDMRELGLTGIAEHLKLLAEHDVTIVAEKVETAEEVDGCVELGIGLFQGYFFEKPRLVRGRPAPAAQIGRLRSATSLTASATFEDVEKLVRNDPGLSVRVLRYINSAAVSLRSNVSSLRHALMLVGANTVRQWLLLVLMGDLGKVRPAVLSTGLVRARLCESLAKDSGSNIALDSAFIVGLLSVCDALLDCPLDEVIPSLPLSDDVRDAIVLKQGPLGELLQTAITLERGEGAPDAKKAYALYTAVQWANEQLAEFGDDDAAAA